MVLRGGDGRREKGEGRRGEGAAALACYEPIVAPGILKINFPIEISDSGIWEVHLPNICARNRTECEKNSLAGHGWPS